MNWFALLGLDGWLARIRAAVIECAIGAEDRLDLVQLEWAEQKRRLGLMVLLTVAVAGLTVVVLILLSLAVLVQFWDSPHRALVGWLLAGGWTLLWAIALASLVSITKQAGNAFALTRRELTQDWRNIKERL